MYEIMASKAFKAYLDTFILFSDMTKHFPKLWQCFEKC